MTTYIKFLEWLELSDWKKVKMHTLQYGKTLHKNVVAHYLDGTLKTIWSRIDL